MTDTPWVSLRDARAYLAAVIGGAEAEAEILLRLRRNGITAYAESLSELEVGAGAAAAARRQLGYGVALEPGFWIEVNRGGTNDFVNWEGNLACHSFGPPPHALRAAESIYFNTEEFLRLFELFAGGDGRGADDAADGGGTGRFSLAEVRRRFDEFVAESAAPVAKEDAQAGLEQRLGRRIAKRQFDRIWAEAAPDAWKKPGPKRRQAINRGAESNR